MCFVALVTLCCLQASQVLANDYLKHSSMKFKRQNDKNESERHADVSPRGLKNLK